jgi:hypothetical protein
VGQKLVNDTFQPHDAEEILKIKTPNEDIIACQFEKNGIFTVKSAYRLATMLKREDAIAGINAPNGERKLWRNIWKAPAPNKVRFFNWQLANDNLPMERNKWRRNLKVHNTCKICGNGVDDSFHAVIECTKARALRCEMRKQWELPREEDMIKTGEDWLLVLLDKKKKKYTRLS